MTREEYSTKLEKLNEDFNKLQTQINGIQMTTHYIMNSIFPNIINQLQELFGQARFDDVTQPEPVAEPIPEPVVETTNENPQTN